VDANTNEPWPGRARALAVLLTGAGNIQPPDRGYHTLVALHGCSSCILFKSARMWWLDPLLRTAVSHVPWRLSGSTFRTKGPSFFGGCVGGCGGESGATSTPCPQRLTLAIGNGRWYCVVNAPAFLDMQVCAHCRASPSGSVFVVCTRGAGYMANPALPVSSFPGSRASPRNDHSPACLLVMTLGTERKCGAQP
jgi:hypothetical protein